MTERHATPREVADLADGILTGPRRERVAAHLAAGCRTCEAALVRTSHLVAAITEGPLPAPPRAVLRRATGLFAAARRAAATDRVREFLAALVLDRRLAPAVALRGEPGDARRLLWTFADVEVVVSIASQGGRADVLGEVLPEVAAAVGSVRLECVRGATYDAPLDAEGAFAMRGVEPGSYVLRGVVCGAAFRTPPFVID